jgi:5-methylcytosine-specific restriction endonuclease McrA
MPRGVRDQGRRVRARIIVERVLARGRRKGWTDAQTATVVVASLTPNRVTFGIVGPCFYCGSDLASTVDHLVPVISGGSDDPWNLVSCCVSCNSLKHDDEWQWLGSGSVSCSILDCVKAQPAQ